MSTDTERVPAPRRGLSPTQRAGLAVVGVFAAACVLQLAWLGWDIRKDVDSTGRETGPWEPWQVYGAIASVAVMVAVAARWMRAFVIAGVVAAAVTWLLVVEGFINDAGDPFFGFIFVAAALLCITTFGATLLVALPARALWQLASPAKGRSL